MKQSFASRIKEEICRQTGGARHCRLAELSALLVFGGGLRAEEDGQAEVLRMENPAARQRASFLLQKLFGAEAVQIGEDTERAGLRLSADTALKVRAAVRPDDPAGWIHQPHLQKACCRRAFLRGAFLAAGSVSDPNRSYHFEIACRSDNDAARMQELLHALGIPARTTRRKGQAVVYVKEAAQIGDLLRLMDVRVLLLDFENIRILREVRGNVNRRVNCETANISKTAAASARQLEDIRFLERTVGFSKLPNGLDEIAQVRLQYPTATLQELGNLLHPPVGKSGVNHRLRRIGLLAEKIREQEGGDHGQR